MNRIEALNMLHACQDGRVSCLYALNAFEKEHVFIGYYRIREANADEPPIVGTNILYRYDKLEDWHLARVDENFFSYSWPDTVEWAYLYNPELHKANCEIY